MKSPKIRFEGYKDGWEQRKLGEVLSIATRKNGEQFTKKDVLSVSDVYGCVNQIRLQGRSFAGEDITNYKVVKTGDIVYTRSPLQAKPYGIIKIVEAETGIISPLYIVNEVMGNNDASFVYYTFDSPQKTNSYLSPLVRKGAKNTMNISNEEWLSGDVMIATDIEEQKKIGIYFRQLDNLITIHQRKCEETKTLKKYMLQKMFPQNGTNAPEIRFDGFTDAWEQCKFGDIAERVSTTGISGEEVPSVEYEDVVSEQGLLNKDISQKKTIKTGIRFSGKEVLYGKLRPYLHNWLNPDFQGIAVGDWWVLKPVNLDKNFLYRLIQTPHFDNMANQSSGTKMPRADWKLISNTEFCIPKDLKEQEKIGVYFSNLDKIITLHQQKCDELQNIKKFMLQNMFV